MDDKGADTVRELNAVKECWEVEREMGCRMLLVRRWVDLEIVGRGREHMGLRASMGIICHTRLQNRLGGLFRRFLVV